MRTLTGEAGDGAGTALTGLCLYLTGQQYPRFFWFSSPESGHKNAHLTDEMSGRMGGGWY